MSPQTHRVITNQVAIASQCAVFVLDYRLCPETPFPGAIEDALCAYLALTQPNGLEGSKCVFKTHKQSPHNPLAAHIPLSGPTNSVGPIDPSRLFIMGDSSGACLSLQLLYTIMALGMPNPAALTLISPFLDHEMKSPSWHKNWNSDFLSLDMAGVEWAMQIYSNGLHPAHKSLTPLYSNLESLPPILIQSGDSEVVLVTYKGNRRRIAVCSSSKRIRERG
jgi:epsilon-lactone hydrolase